MLWYLWLRRSLTSQIQAGCEAEHQFPVLPLNLPCATICSWDGRSFELRQLPPLCLRWACHAIFSAGGALLATDTWSVFRRTFKRTITIDGTFMQTSRKLDFSTPFTTFAWNWRTSVRSSSKLSQRYLSTWECIAVKAEKIYFLSQIRTTTVVRCEGFDALLCSTYD